MYVRSQLENWYTDSQKFAMLIPWDQEDISERPKLRTHVVSSSPSEGGSCSSETNHDRRTARGRKSFVSKSRLQKQRPESENLSSVRVPVKMVYVSRKLNTTAEQGQEQSCMFRRIDYSKKTTTSKKGPEF
jgi:hypothetical protein